MKTISVRDARTNQALSVSYDPGTGEYEINGVDVVRIPELEDKEVEVVFGFPEAGAYRLHHITKQDLERLRNAPDCEE